MGKNQVSRGSAAGPGPRGRGQGAFPPPSLRSPGSGDEASGARARSRRALARGWRGGLTLRWQNWNNKMYISATEWKEMGGFKDKTKGLPFKRLPFHCVRATRRPLAGGLKASD